METMELSNVEITKNQKELLSFLNKLYEITKDDYVKLSLGKFARDSRLKYSSETCHLIIKHKLLLRERFWDNTDTGTFVKHKWNSIKPNSKMAKKLEKYLEETLIIKAQQRKDKKKKKETYPILKEKQITKNEFVDELVERHNDFKEKIRILEEEKHNFIDVIDKLDNRIFDLNNKCDLLKSENKSLKDGSEFIELSLLWGLIKTKQSKK